MNLMKDLKEEEGRLKDNERAPEMRSKREGDVL